MGTSPVRSRSLSLEAGRAGCARPLAAFDMRPTRARPATPITRREVPMLSRPFGPARSALGRSADGRVSPRLRADTPAPPPTRAPAPVSSLSCRPLRPIRYRLRSCESLDEHCGRRASRHTSHSRTGGRALPREPSVGTSVNGSRSFRRGTGRRPGRRTVEARARFDMVQSRVEAPGTQERDQPILNILTGTARGIPSSSQRSEAPRKRGAQG